MEGSDTGLGGIGSESQMDGSISDGLEYRLSQIEGSVALAGEEG